MVALNADKKAILQEIALQVVDQVVEVVVMEDVIVMAVEIVMVVGIVTAEETVIVDEIVGVIATEKDPDQDLDHKQNIKILVFKSFFFPFKTKNNILEFNLTIFGY